MGVEDTEDEAFSSLHSGLPVWSRRTSREKKGRCKGYKWLLLHVWGYVERKSLSFRGLWGIPFPDMDCAAVRSRERARVNSVRCVSGVIVKNSLAHTRISPSTRCRPKSNLQDSGDPRYREAGPLRRMPSLRMRASKCMEENARSG